MRVKRKGELEFFVGRRYGDFSRLYKALRTELPGRVLPPLPKKNKSSSTTSNILGSIAGGNDSEASSLSSVSTFQPGNNGADGNSKLLTVKGHRRTGSSTSGRSSPRPSADGRPPNTVPLSPTVPEVTPSLPCSPFSVEAKWTLVPNYSYSPLRCSEKIRGYLCAPS